MTSFLLPVLVVATLAALTASWVKRMPTWNFCPTCGHRTQAIVAPAWLRPAERWLTVRWCADCDWQRVGRKGPDWIPGRQIAHDSGFHWGANQTGENLGFRWKTIERLPPEKEPPAHPSGFRFADRPAPPKAGPKPAHESGFTWGDGVQPPGSARRKPNHPSGFTWAERRPDRSA